MSTDRELLELAAKAYGVSTYIGIDGRTYLEGSITTWNPLHKDDDALRLAVKCGIVVEYRREVPGCFAYHYALNLEVMQRNDHLDPYEATRRAIVRTAARIGAFLAPKNSSQGQIPG